MPQSTLDIIINPRGANQGANEVNNALRSIQSNAKSAVDTMRTKFDSLKDSLFNLRNLFLGLGVVALGKSFIDVAISLEKAERGLRAMHGSATQAKKELDELRQIGDRFQLPDEQIIGGYRKLLSLGITDGKKAVETIANAAIATSVDFDTVLTGIMAHQERSLRQLGIRIIDGLGTGEVVLALGNMQVKVKETDEAMRAGLLQLMERGFPNAAKGMADSLDFNIKRMADVWEDFQVKVMDAGLKDFGVGIFGALASIGESAEIDGSMDKLAKKISDKVQAVVRTIARDIAVVIDVIRPAATIIFKILEDAFSAFSKLPPEIQTIGIFGSLWFGKKGLVLLTAGLALAERLGLSFEKVDQAMEKMKGVGGESSVSDKVAKFMLPLMGPFGALLGSREGAAGDKPSITNPFAGLAKSTETETKTALQTVEDFFRKVDDLAKKSADQRKKATVGTGKSLVGSPVDENEIRVMAAIQKLGQESLRQQLQERLTRNPNFDPVLAQTEIKSREVIQALTDKGLNLSEKHGELIRQIIADTEREAQATAFWQLQQENLNKQLQQTTEFYSDLFDNLEAAQQATERLQLPEADRREVELRQQMMNAALRDGLNLNQQMVDTINRAAKGIADQERAQASLRKGEELRKASLERTAELEARIADLKSGRTAASFATRLDREIRQAEQANAPLSGGQIIERGAAISKEMDLEKAAAKETLNVQLDREFQTLYDLSQLTGKVRTEREIESRVIEERNRLLEQGIELSVKETEDLRDKMRLIQDMKELGRMREGINSFVDSFEVGWDVIARSGVQAYRTLEDALTQFVQTGRLNLTQFVNFFQQEMLRLAIRGSISSLFGAAGGTEGIFNSIVGFMSGGTKGFADGGSFVVGGTGGTDSTPVGFMATPGERVTIERTDRGASGLAVSVPVSVNIVNQVADADVSVQRTKQSGGNKEEITILISQAVNDSIARGRFDKSLGQRFNLSPGRG